MRILVKPFMAQLGYWQICIEYIVTKRALSPDSDELTTGLIVTDMEKDVFHVHSTMIDSKMLALYYRLHIGTSSVICWNLHVAL